MVPCVTDVIRCASRSCVLRALAATDIIVVGGSINKGGRNVTERRRQNLVRHTGGRCGGAPASENSVARRK